MSAMLSITIDGRAIQVEDGTSVAAAILNSGRKGFRRSVDDDARGPVCGMGICFECRVRVDGVEHVRSCLLPCREGMVIEAFG